MNFCRMPRVPQAARKAWDRKAEPLSVITRSMAMPSLAKYSSGGLHEAHRALPCAHPDTSG